MASRSSSLPGSISPHYPAQGQLLGEFLCRLWTTACHVLDLPPDRSLPILQAVLPAWSQERIGLAPQRPSYVADDGFLAEMSVNWSGRPELRLLFDTVSDDDHSDDPRRETAATRRLRQIHDIFRSPRAPLPAAPLWHSIAWRPPAHITHKAYFGLYTWPLAQRNAAVNEAMDRLGMARAWNSARRQVESIDGDREIEFFALDQADRPDARVKIYYRSHGADLREMNRIAAVAPGHDADTALAAYQTLTSNQPGAGPGALSCLAFRPGLEHAAESTTYLRLSELASNDAQAVERTAALLAHHGIDPGRLHALAAAITPTPLQHSRGALCLVSYRAAGRPGDITTYFRFPVYSPPAPVDLVAGAREDDLT